MTTDTTERGLEDLICIALTGQRRCSHRQARRTRDSGQPARRAALGVFEDQDAPEVSSLCFIKGKII